MLKIESSRKGINIELVGELAEVGADLMVAIDVVYATALEQGRIDEAKALKKQWQLRLMME